MSFLSPGPVPLDYQPVTYPGSAMAFRGPAVDLGATQILCLGGSETFGKFVERPYPTLLADWLGRPVANFGAMNAGLDLALSEPAIRAAIGQVETIVLQITGAQGLSNRFYRVHPRRNDRFVAPSATMSALYRDVDFTEFHFTRHMLTVLEAVSAERFAILVRDLQEAWRSRMRHFLRRTPAKIHLLWMASAPPEDGVPRVRPGSDPLFVTAEMVEEVANFAASLSVCVARPEERSDPLEGKIFAPRELSAARLLPSAAQHERAARLLLDRID